MKKLLSIEWLKLKDYNPFKVLSIFFVFGIVLVNIIVYQANKSIIEESLPKGQMFSFHPYDFANTWQTTSYATGFLLVLPAMLLIILVTNEYAYRTSRQNIIDGWSRKEFITVKLALALIFAVVTTLIVFLTALIFGWISGTDFSFHKVSHVFYFFLKALSYNVLAILVSVLVRKTGFAIGLYFIYMGAENIISQLLNLWSIKLKADQNGDYGNMGDYLPMNASDALLTFPDNPIKDMSKMVMPADHTGLVLILALVYLVLFGYFSIRKFVKSDL